MDSRFDFPDPTSWRNGTKQKLFGSEYNVLKPTKPIEEKPKQIEFELMSNNPLLFGNMCRFHIKGKFEKRATADAAWAHVPAADFAKVVLAPNWFENMIQSVDLYHANGIIKCHDESNFIPAQLNTYLANLSWLFLLCNNSPKVFWQKIVGKLVASTLTEMFLS